MTSLVPTEEQLSIIEAAKSSRDNLLLIAFAGAAKTSTLVMIAEALPQTEMLCLSFNKKIAVEMDKRMPNNVESSTLNSLGHRTWSAALGRRLKIDSSKVYNIVKTYIEEQPLDIRTELYENFSELMRLVSFGKQCGYIPSNRWNEVPKKAKALMRDEEFFAHIEAKLTEFEQDLIIECSNRNLDLAFSGECDYDDQILMPTVFHGVFPRFPLILVDEAQDLSALNHAMLRKLAGKRLIAVGDPNQAIYGFRGAHENSMDLLKQAFSMQVLPLSVTFRCAQKIVEHARWKTPSMSWPEWAEVGQVSSLANWKASDFPEDAAIICRNNAPLFRTAIRLLKNGRSAELGGKDIVNYITKIMKKFGSSDLQQQDVLDKINSWLEEQKSKTKPSGHGNLIDRAECMKVFALAAPDLAGALAYAQHISQLNSPLKLLTGHGAKGLEFPHVYFLDAKLCKDKDQDPNIKYVIQTRAKEFLTYINSDDFIDGE